MQALMKISLPAGLNNLAALISPVKDSAVQQGISQKRVMEIELALEETLINIINHAYGGNPGDIEIGCYRTDNNRFVMEIADSGPPFDIFSTKEPDLSADIADRQVGGLGVYIIKQLMDEVTYQRSDTHNILTLAVDIK
jgi:anti-sigma regulatory factor (Ser/Thr protein kinase)